jgi:hypothetical protein
MVIAICKKYISMQRALKTHVRGTRVFRCKVKCCGSMLNMLNTLILGHD